MQSLTDTSYYEHITKIARKLDAAEKAGGPEPAEIGVDGFCERIMFSFEVLLTRMRDHSDH